MASDKMINQFVASGTAAEMDAFHPNPPVTAIIPDYWSTTCFKTVLTPQAGPVLAQSTTNIRMQTFVGFWRSTAAITSISLTLASGNYVAGSKFTLYGIN